MTIRTPKQALAVALATKKNVPGRCQQVIREYYNAPSVGDLDHDGAADAEDGGKSEPGWARHTDRTGREGYPATFFGGRLDNGHRAIFVAPGVVRSTDFNGLTKRYSPGMVGNGTVAEVERAMTAPGFTPVKFAFWSETIDGLVIPKDPEPAKPKTRGWRIAEMLRLGRRARKEAGPNKRKKIQRALDALRSIAKH